MRLAAALEGYRGKTVLITGHTGFKGAWLSLWLSSIGAKVVGLSNSIPTTPSLYDCVGLRPAGDHRSDIRDLSTTKMIVDCERPDIIFHLAAQPIVRTALADPYDTIAINVLGTTAILEAAREVSSVRGVVVITSDKVYRDRALADAYKENDTLGGHEPYGASKAAAEIIAEVYMQASFHAGAGSRNIPKIVTARAGNVIGGGDWAANRLIPDTVNAILAGNDVTLRYPRSTRPWQHVLEPLSGYLLLGQRILADEPFPHCINFGPSESTATPVIEIVEKFLSVWGPTQTKIVVQEDISGVEAAALQVDSSLAQEVLGWQALWNAERAVAETASWYRAWASGTADMNDICRQQIAAYTNETERRSYLQRVIAA